MHLLIVLGPAPVGLFFTAVMATAPTEGDIWRAIDRLGRKYRVSEFIVYYLKAGRHLESEATSTLQEQWALARRNSITAHNRWQILSLEIELALRGEACRRRLMPERACGADFPEKSGKLPVQNRTDRPVAALRSLTQ